MTSHTRSLMDYLKDFRDRDFACKVRERMRRDRNPMLVTIQDKYALRAYANARDVKMATLFHVSDTAEDMPFSTLPSDCFIKANNASGRNILRKDAKLYLFGDGSCVMTPDGRIKADTAASYLLSQDVGQRLCHEWLHTSYAKNEWAYLQMKPKLLAEEVLHPRTEGELKDIRFYTFDGTVRAISVGSPGYRQRRENVFFDAEWHPFELTCPENRPDPLPERPSCLPEMIEIAGRLGHGLDFVRVDLYDTNRGVILGEMTVYPEAGHRKTPSPCLTFNRWLGRQWRVDRRHFVR